MFIYPSSLRIFLFFALMCVAACQAKLEPGTSGSTDESTDDPSEVGEEAGGDEGNAGQEIQEVTKEEASNKTKPTPAVTPTPTPDPTPTETPSPTPSPTPTPVVIPAASAPSALRLLMGDEQISVNWSGGDAASYLLIRRASVQVDWTPTDGVEYTQGQDLGNGLTVAYIGAAESFVDTNLTNNTTYHYSVFGANEANEYTSPQAEAEDPTPILWSANGIVRTHEFSGDTLFFGGQFSAVGAPTAQHVAFYNMAGEVLPGFEYPSSNRSVYSVLGDGQGGFYASGYFDEFAGATRFYMAHVLPDGTLGDWDPVFKYNGNLSNVVTMVESDGLLYVGGRIHEVDGIPRNGVAVFDMSTGDLTSFSADITIEIYKYVKSIVVTGSYVYVGGDFEEIESQARPYVAQLDKTTGALIAGWNANANDEVNTLLYENNTLYVGGEFTSIGGQSRNKLAALNTSNGNALAFDPNVNSPADAMVRTMVSDGTNLYFGGTFGQVDGTARSNIAAVNLSTDALQSWNPNAVGSGVYSLTLNGTDLYAGGVFTQIGGQLRRNLALLSTGSDAAQALTLDPEGVVYSIYVDAARDQLAIGGDFRFLDTTDRNGMAALNTLTGEPTAFNPSITGGAVHDLAVDGDYVYIGGWFSLVGGSPRDKIAKIHKDTGVLQAWDPGADSNINHISSILVRDSTILVGGDFTRIAGEDRDGLVEIDKTTGALTAWDPQISGGWNEVQLVKELGNYIYLGGYFSSVGGNPRDLLARLDKDTLALDPWAGLSFPGNTFPFAPWVSDIELDNGTLYIAGDFLDGDGTYGMLRSVPEADTTLTDWKPNSTADRWCVGQTLEIAEDNVFFGGIEGNCPTVVDKQTGAVLDYTPFSDDEWVVWSMEVRGNRVYVFGDFTSINGKPRPNIGVFSKTTIFAP